MRKDRFTLLKKCCYCQVKTHHPMMVTIKENRVTLHQCIDTAACLSRIRLHNDSLYIERGNTI